MGYLHGLSSDRNGSIFSAEVNAYAILVDQAMPRPDVSYQWLWCVGLGTSLWYRRGWPRSHWVLMWGIFQTPRIQQCPWQRQTSPDSGSYRCDHILVGWMQEGRKCILMIFQEERFSFCYNKMCIGNNLNLILNDLKVIGSYWKILTIC